MRACVRARVCVHVPVGRRTVARAVAGADCSAVSVIRFAVSWVVVVVVVVCVVCVCVVDVMVSGVCMGICG